MKNEIRMSNLSTFFFSIVLGYLARNKTREGNKWEVNGKVKLSLVVHDMISYLKDPRTPPNSSQS
jgi:hypothetical protein